MYSAISLGSLGGSSTYGAAINASGQVAGWSYDANGNQLAFLWTNGVMQNLGTLPGTGSSAANGLNDSGDVVGGSGDYGFVYRNGTMSALPRYEVGLWTSTVANGINNSGVIVGASSTYPGYDLPVMWGPNGLELLGPSTGCGNAKGINSSGQIAGSIQVGGLCHAAIWNNGSVTDLGSPTGADTFASAINDNGEVVGSSGYFFALWNNGIATTAIGPYPQGNGAFDVNNSGVAVGFGGFSTGGVIYANGALTPISALVDPQLCGSALCSLTAINDSGQIVLNRGYGATESFLLTPVGTPEPASSGLAGLACAAWAAKTLMTRRRHRAV